MIRKVNTLHWYHDNFAHFELENRFATSQEDLQMWKRGKYHEQWLTTAPVMAPDEVKKIWKNFPWKSKENSRLFVRSDCCYCSEPSWHFQMLEKSVKRWEYLMKNGSSRLQSWTSIFHQIFSSSFSTTTMKFIKNQVRVYSPCGYSSSYLLTLDSLLKVGFLCSLRILL